MVRKEKGRIVGTTDPDTMQMAVDSVIKNGFSVRKAALTFGIKLTTLQRYVKKQKDAPTEIINMEPNYVTRKMFTNNEEQLIVDNIIKRCEELPEGLSLKEAREKVYKTVLLHNLKMPNSWCRDKLAGIEWMRSFLKRKDCFEVLNKKVYYLKHDTLR